MSVRILPPVHNVSSPTALTPLQRTGITIRNRALKKFPTHFHVEERAGWNIWVLSRYWTRDLPVGGTTVQVDPSIWMYVGGFDVDIYKYYHLETRRKCRTNFLGCC